MAKIHPWPATIIAYFSIIICGVVALVVHSLKNKVELVRPDYYEQEVKYQDQIERIKRTKPFLAEIAISYKEQHLQVSLPDGHTSSDDFSGSVWIYRPSNVELDQKLELRSNPTSGPYNVESDLAPGLWRVKVDWQAGGKEYFFEDSFMVE